MTVTVVVPRALRRFSDHNARVDVKVSDPATLRQVLAELASQYPGVTDRVLDDQCELRRHVLVFVGADNARDLDGLDTVVQDGSEVTVVPAVSGGAR